MIKDDDTKLRATPTSDIERLGSPEWVSAARTLSKCDRPASKVAGVNTYKPRRWTGPVTATPHWWWDSRMWLLIDSLAVSVGIADRLSPNDIFLRPDAPEPTEPPG